MLTNFHGAQTGSQVLLVFPLVFSPILGSISTLLVLSIKLHGRLQAEQALWQKTQGELCPGRLRAVLCPLPWVWGSLVAPD